MSRTRLTCKRIGIMGGTFDPVHFGHLVAAEGARYHFNLDRVVFVPSARPPHKDCQDMTHPAHRYNMTVLATSSNPNFSVSEVEIKREGVSYTVDTIAYFKDTMPEALFYFITGADAVLEILTWHRVADLMDLCRIIAATRPGYPLENLSEILKWQDSMHKEKIAAMEVPALAISSTDIRDRVRRGMPIKYLLPEEVEQYIYREGLYSGFEVRGSKNDRIK